MNFNKANKFNPVCIIPARGGSKRVKDKNIRIINGKPLLFYTIDIARRSSLFSKIIVNSEDNNILRIAQKYGADIYKRPQELSEDAVLLIDVIKEMLMTMNLPDRTIAGIMLATCPLKSVDDIKKAWDIFTKNGMHSPVVSVTPYERPIYLAHKISKKSRLAPVFPKDYSRTTRSQEHTTVYWYNGAVIFNTVKQLKTQKNLIGKEPAPYVMPFERSIDIDHEFQVKFVKSILGKSRKG